MSGPQNDAGIWYGLTGVCHQIANRILDPAGILVEQARGYNVSELVFGKHGIGPWPERARCGSPGAGSFSSGAGTGASAGSGSVSFEAPSYDEAILMAHRSTRSEDVEATELAALVQRKLGHELEAKTFQDLLTVQKALRDRRAFLAQQLATKRITPEEYLSQFNMALRQAMMQNKNLLGAEKFRAIFGDAGDQPELLVDRKAFFNQDFSKLPSR